MRRDITIARVKWGVRDVLLALGLVITIPIVVVIVFVLISKTGIIPLQLVTAVKDNELVFTSLVELLVLGAELGALIWVAKRREASLRDFGFRKFKFFRTILQIVVMYICLLVLVAIVYYILVWLWPTFNVNEVQSSGFEFGEVGVGLWLSFTSTVLIAPIIEEIYFRGFIMPAATKRFGWLIGLVGSAGLFAGLHLQLNVVVYTFIFGLLLGVLYIRSKSIIPGIFLHILNNALAFSVLIGWVG